MIPLVEGWEDTFEDTTKAKNDLDRLLFFGQRDHIRFYGKDVRHRIESAGFRIDEFVAKEPDVARYGLMRGEKVFLCWRP